MKKCKKSMFFQLFSHILNRIKTKVIAYIAIGVMHMKIL